MPPGPDGVTAKLLADCVLHDCNGFTNALVIVAMLTITLANMVTTM